MTRLFHRDKEVAEALLENIQLRLESLDCTQFSAQIDPRLAEHSWA